MKIAICVFLLMVVLSNFKVSGRYTIKNVNNTATHDLKRNYSQAAITGHDLSSETLHAANCKCTNGYCEEDNKGNGICKCYPEWGNFGINKCKECDCGKGANCTFTGFWDTKTCICKEGYTVVSEKCKVNRCEGTCGAKDGVKCVGEAYGAKDVTCECENKDLTFVDKVQGCKMDRCKDMCGQKDGVKCVGEVYGDDKVTCECEHKDQMFIDKVQGCKVNRCKDMCGQKDGVKCMGDAYGDDEVSCECEHKDLTFVDKVQGCRGTCKNDSYCKNGGICVRAEQFKFCKCLHGTSGYLCDIVDECKDIECLTGAFCAFHIEKETAFCKCTNEKLSYHILELKCKRSCVIDSDCKNKGTCEAIGTSKFCQCKKGKSGDMCEVVNNCNEFNCGDDAICAFDARKKTAFFSCECRNKTLNFDSSANKCKRSCAEDSECKNGGVCGQVGIFKFCICKKGRSGDLCEKQNVCDGYDCGQDATCFVDEKTGNVICRFNRCKVKCGEKESVICVGNAFGDEEVSCECKSVDQTFIDKDLGCKVNRCKVKCGEKESVICVGNAFGDDEISCECKCVDQTFIDKDLGCKVNRCKVKCGEKENVICVGDVFGDDEVSCECKSVDQTFIDKDQGCKDLCDSNPCLNGGTCSVKNNEIKCACQDTYTGNLCEINQCDPNPCENGGTCSLKNGKANCTCKDPYIGNWCEIIHQCHPNPCQNGGTCSLKNGKANCTCKDPYTGNLCEINPCSWNPCQNGGICRIENGAANCFCRNNFTGKNCEIQKNPCSENPCQNGGSCFLRRNSFMCNCKKPYFGTTCESDSCSENPCQNGGSCFIRKNTFMCICQNPYYGTTCESDSTNYRNVLIIAVLATAVVFLAVFSVCQISARQFKR